MRVLKLISLLILMTFFCVSLSSAKSSEEYHKYKKGMEYGIAGNFAAARAEFEQLAKISSSDHDIQAIKSNSKECLKVIKDIDKQIIKKETAVYFFKAMALYSENSLDEAIYEFEKFAALNPNYVVAHYNLGNAYGKKGMLNEAIAEYKKAISINPKDSIPHYNLGLSYDKKGMLNEAMGEYNQAIKINPQYADAHNNLGVAYYKKGMLNEAIAEYKKAISINSKDSNVHYNLGLSYYKKGMLNEAMGEYKKAILFNPKDFEAHVNLGEIYCKKRMLDEAIAEYKKAISINHKCALAYNKLAAIFFYSKNDYNTAIKFLDRAIQLGYKPKAKFLKDIEPYREKK